jgi:hypothetical protein
MHPQKAQSDMLRWAMQVGREDTHHFLGAVCRASMRAWSGLGHCFRCACVSIHAFAYAYARVWGHRRIWGTGMYGEKGREGRTAWPSTPHATHTTGLGHVRVVCPSSRPAYPPTTNQPPSYAHFPIFQSVGGWLGTYSFGCNPRASAPHTSVRTTGWRRTKSS